LATAKARQGRGKRGRLVWVLVVLVALAALWAVFGSAALGYARAGSAYGARVACSCRFGAGRRLEDCGKDRLKGMELVSLSDDAEAKSVTARMLFLASDTAAYRAGYGCVLERWDQ